MCSLLSATHPVSMYVRVPWTWWGIQPPLPLDRLSHPEPGSRAGENTQEIWNEWEQAGRSQNMADAQWAVRLPSRTMPRVRVRACGRACVRACVRVCEQTNDGGVLCLW